MIRYFSIQLNNTISTQIAETAIDACCFAIDKIKNKNGDYEQLSLISCKEIKQSEYYDNVTIKARDM